MEVGSWPWAVPSREAAAAAAAVACYSSFGAGAVQIVVEDEATAVVETPAVQMEEEVLAVDSEAAAVSSCLEGEVPRPLALDSACQVEAGVEEVPPLECCSFAHAAVEVAVWAARCC